MTIVEEWIGRGAKLESEHDKIQFASAMEFFNKIDFTNITRIADIGSGPGHQAFYMQQCGLDVVCIDYLKPVYSGLAVEPPDSDKLGTFDAVWSHHCLEHIADPIGALIKWRSLLKPGGELFLTVPEIGIVMSPGHINSFNLPLLMYQLAIAGFDCSTRRFTKSRSHLRASVRPAVNYDPNAEGRDYSLTSLAKKKLFPDTVADSIIKTGRYSVRDMHLDWYGEKSHPKNLTLEAYDFITNNFWSR
jgi:SAM-dependent methyltransferase